MTFTINKSASSFKACLLFCTHVTGDAHNAHIIASTQVSHKSRIYPTTREPFSPLMDEKEVLAATRATFIN